MSEEVGVVRTGKKHSWFYVVKKCEKKKNVVPCEALGALG